MRVQNECELRRSASRERDRERERERESSEGLRGEGVRVEKEFE